MAYSKIRPSGGDTSTPLNLDKRLFLIQSYIDLHGKKVIDCGCGTGHYVKALYSLGADAYGIEYESEKVAKFKREHSEIADRVLLGNIEEINFETEYFDLALANEVLEHVPNDIQALREIYRVLKPDGILIILSPNRLYPFETHSVYLKQSSNQVPLYIPFIPNIPLPLEQRVFDYIARNYWPFRLRQLVRDSGFKIIGTNYLWQKFENISGRQPAAIAWLTPLLRRVFAFVEQVPVIRIFGVSQVVVAQK